MEREGKIIQKDIEKDSTEQKRIQTWRERLAKERPSFKYEARKNEGDNSIQILPALDKNEQLTGPEKAEILRATLCAATGSASEEVGQMLFSQAIAGNFLNGKDLGFIANAVHQSALSLAPQDEIEGMLIHRLIVLHSQYMHYISSTTGANQSDAKIDLNINRATKLMRLYNETLDALNKHRRKGEQRVIVQHVNVNNGGQAVVTGRIHQGEGVHDKK